MLGKSQLTRQLQAYRIGQHKPHQDLQRLRLRNLKFWSWNSARGWRGTTAEAGRNGEAVTLRAPRGSYLPYPITMTSTSAVLSQNSACRPPALHVTLRKKTIPSMSSTSTHTFLCAKQRNKSGWQQQQQELPPGRLRIETERRSPTILLNRFF